jgi:integrase
VSKLTDIRVIQKTNGRNYTVRGNRDRFFYPKEWNKFYAQLKEPQRKTFECLINTGARINEVRHIKKEDVEFDNNRLILRVTKVKSRNREKNPRPRTIPISSAFSRKLRGYFKEKNGSDYIGLLSTAAANTAMKKALQKAGIQDYQMFSIHNIRKTLECWLMALNVDGLKLTVHFGHTMAVSARHYVSPDAFTSEERMLIRDIIGDLYQVRY